MYQKILVPLDKSKEAEEVIPLVQKFLALGGEVILLHVISLGRTRSVGEIVWLGTPQEEQERTQATWYLRDLVSRIDEEFGRWYGDVVVSSSVADGIATYSTDKKVDLIMMYTYDRKGLSKLIKEIIAEKVWHRAPN